MDQCCSGWLWDLTAVSPWYKSQLLTCYSPIFGILWCKYVEVSHPVWFLVDFNLFSDPKVFIM